MTYQFSSARQHGVSSSTICSILAFPRKRLRLAARWQLGTDGRLECRWHQQSG